MTIDDRKLLHDVREHIAAHPERATAFLNAVSGGLDAFAKVAREHRDMVALSAIHNSMGQKPTSVPRSIDAAMFRWPDGPRKSSMSTREAKWWDEFYRIAVAYDESEGHASVDAWLTCKRGGAKWWRRHVRGM